MPHVTAPQLYQEILSLIAELERAGRLSDARRAGDRAKAVYAAGWDANQVRVLDQLRSSIRKSLARPRVPTLEER